MSGNKDSRRRDSVRSSPSDGATHWTGEACLAVALLAAMLPAYQPAWHGGMLWDDDAHITEPQLRSAGALGRIWFEPGATQQYYPLTHSAFWVQYQLWGDDTLGYHLVNIVLHASSALLVALILRRLGVPGAYLAAAIFALHPVHVESVAWISELKNVLSGVLYLGAALAYLHFDDSRRQAPYVLALALFVLALLSKTVTATLPAALLVVFWWQRGRLGWQRDVGPLVPFFLLGAAAGLFTAGVERRLIGAEGSEFAFTALERCLIAGRALWFYLGKLAWPAELVFIYPRWEISQAVWWQYLFPLGMAGLFAGLWLLRSRWRAPLAAFLFFAGTLFPALGFVNVYPFRYSFVADHFQYLASLGIISLFAASATLVIARARISVRPAAITIGLLLVGVLGVLTGRQCRHYVDAETLYRETISRNPACWMAQNNWGKILQDAGRREEALVRYQEALRIKGDLPEVQNNWGSTLQQLGRSEEALAHYEEALRLKPDYAEAQFNRGSALQALGRMEEAMVHYREALRLKRDYAEAHNNLGIALQGLGRPLEAVGHFHAALRFKLEYAEAHNNCGNALQDAGRMEEAMIHYQEALRLRPGYAEAQFNWGNALLGSKRIDEAMVHYEAALRLKPDYAKAQCNWGIALTMQGRHQDAAEHFQKALQLQPDLAAARANLRQAQALLREKNNQH